MYGLINKSLRNMICERFGEAQWQSVLETSGVPGDSFLTMRSYDDEITYRLAGAASEVLGAPIEDCLEMFGEYWVLETASKSYASLMDASGTSLQEFLENLNALHDRITGTFLNYIPPEFRIEEMGGDQHRIHYISQRQGLTPFVTGLLHGLAKRFGNDLEIHEQRNMPVETGEYTVFEVTLR